MHLNIYNRRKKQTTFSGQKYSGGYKGKSLQTVDFGDFFMEANNTNPDQTAPKEQSDLGPYCLQYRLLRTYGDERADNKSLDWG